MISVVSMYSLRERFYLEDNPFGVTPAPQQITWADRKEFKTKIEDMIKFAVISSPSKIVGCFHGDWGMGKTHAATYFSQAKILQKLASEVSIQKEPVPIKIILPPRDIFDSIYLDIIDAIGMNRIDMAIDAIEKGRQPLDAESFQILKEKTQDERLARVLSYRGDIREKYLLLSAKSSDLSDLKVTRLIETISDKLRTLRGIFNLLTGTNYSKIFLWIDDSERIERMTGRDLADLQVFLRDLLDYVPQNLNIIMNFTLVPGRKIEDIIQFLGDAIRTRINQYIEIKELTNSDFFEYIVDLLSHFRLKGSEVGPLFPFEEDALQFIFEEINKRGLTITPRRINNALSNILQDALLDTRIKTIDRPFVQKVIDKALRE